MKLSTFPERFNFAKLKSISKKGARAFSFFRPISLLPLVSIIIRKLYHFQITKNLFECISQALEQTINSTYFCLTQFIDFVLTGMGK